MSSSSAGAEMACQEPRAALSVAAQMKSGDFPGRRGLLPPRVHAGVDDMLGVMEPVPELIVVLAIRFEKDINETLGVATHGLCRSGHKYS